MKSPYSTTLRPKTTRWILQKVKVCQYLILVWCYLSVHAGFRTLPLRSGSAQFWALWHFGYSLDACVATSVCVALLQRWFQSLPGHMVALCLLSCLRRGAVPHDEEALRNFRRAATNVIWSRRVLRNFERRGASMGRRLFKNDSIIGSGGSLIRAHDDDTPHPGTFVAMIRVCSQFGNSQDHCLFV